jgi:hypothetical protein
VNVARAALSTLLALPLVGCWNWNIARDPGMRPPERPRVHDGTGKTMPDWMRNPPVGENELFASKDGFRAKSDRSFTVDVRLHAKRHALLADRSTIQIDIPIGYAGQPIGLAELTALAVGDTPAGAGQEPSLRAWLTQLGGDLVIDVGAMRTRFTVHAPTDRWESVLDRIAQRLDATAVTQTQFATLQDRLIRTLLNQWESDPTYGYASQWLRFGDRDRTAIIGAVQDRHLAELRLFQRRHYKPEGSALGVWMPDVNQPERVVSVTRFGLAAWQNPPLPKPTPKDLGAGAAASESPAGVRWIEGPGRSRVAILIPNAPHDLEWNVMMDCFTLRGLGGRLGESLRDPFGRQLVFHVRELGSDDQRFLVLETSLEARSVPKLWKAVHEAWASLSTAAPIGDELAGAKARVRLRLARRQDHADEWLDAAGARRQPGGPIRDLHALAQISHVRGIVPAWSKTRLAMVVVGGTIPDGAPKSFAKFEITQPGNRRRIESAPTLAKETKRYLDLAVNAIGDRRTFESWMGYDLKETWNGPDSLVVKMSTLARPPHKMSRTTDILATRISTEVDASRGEKIVGTETVGTEKKELVTGEAADLLSEANRHPLALLAGWVQGGIEFRMIGVRGRKGYEVAVLERIDPNRSRLRMAIDTKSGLIRSVETIRQQAGMGAVLVRESYDDYRRTNAYRVPMHRVATVGGDADGVDWIVQSFEALNR